MLEPFGFVVLCLAAYRLTRFFVNDSLIGFGPDSGSTMSVRVDRFAYFDNGEDRSWLRGRIGDLLTCVFCLGFHVSWVLVCFWVAAAPWELGIHGWTIAFAVAGAQGYLNTRMNA